MNDIEEVKGAAAASDGQGDRVNLWLILYPIGWIALFFVSLPYWFLPAGLRLGTLWLLPRRHWWKMAAIEWLVLALLSLARGTYELPLALLLATMLPWCFYALAVSLLRPRRRDDVPQQAGSIPSLLLAGGAAALLTAASLAVADWLNGGAPSGGWGPQALTYAVGDFVGLLLVAPLLLVAHERGMARVRDWSGVGARGAIVLPVAVAVMLSLLPIGGAPIYALVLSLFPLFWCAFRFGWQTAALALALLGMGLVGVDEGMDGVWRSPYWQLLVAAAGCGVLLLGSASDTLRAQREKLIRLIGELSDRNRQLPQAAKRLALLQEEERRRIGIELHDQLGQDMTAIAARLRVVERTNGEAGIKAGLASIKQLVADAHVHLREIIQHLHPVVLDRFGLARALCEGPMAEMLRDRDIDYLPEIKGDIDQIDETTAGTLYRICQEAANNCVRHVGHGRFRINIALLQGPYDAVLNLAIHDDAGEVPLYKTRTGRGLKSIADRADALGAAYHFNRESGQPRHSLMLRLPAMGQQTGTRRP